MLEREKVIKGLECHQNPYGCSRCLYWDREAPLKDCDNNKLIADALALLREQEPVEPTAKDEVIRVKYNCGGCGYLVGFVSTIHDDMQYRAKFCPECGRKVKWDATD